MTEDKRIRSNLTRYFRDLPCVPDMKISEYFTEKNSEPNEGQAEAVAEFGDKTIHEFIMWVFENSSRLSDDFPMLAEINREPLNHFDILYRLYSAAV
jgi:hypothetical protein